MAEERFGDLARLVGRILIAAIFIYDATQLVRFPEGSATFMEQFGVPALLLYPTAIFEFFGGLLIVIGLFTRLTALAFTGFCLLTALIFHHDLANSSEVLQFGKDLGLAGGFMFLFASGAGCFSFDQRRLGARG